MSKEITKNCKYDDSFSSHIAKHMIYQDGNEVLEFRKKGGSNEYAITFSKIGYYFNINGDLGDACFTWFNDKLSFEDIAGFSYSEGYFHSKMQSSELGSRMMSFDSEECVKDVEGSLLESGIDYEEHDEFSYWRDYTGDEIEWISFVRANGEEFFQDQDHWEYSYGFGQKTHLRFYIWIEALRRAVLQIKKAGQ